MSGVMLLRIVSAVSAVYFAAKAAMRAEPAQVELVGLPSRGRCAWAEPSKISRSLPCEFILPRATGRRQGRPEYPTALLRVDCYLVVSMFQRIRSWACLALSSPRKSASLMLPPVSIPMLEVDANLPIIDLLDSMETERMFL